MDARADLQQYSRSLERETAIVTGGSHGIGRAIVKLFAAEGASVVFCARNVADGEALAHEFGGDARVDFVPADVSREDDLNALVDYCARRLEPPSILVNNAGMNAHLDAENASVGEWDHVVAVDLRSAWLAAKYALPHMRGRGGGSIINISSIHAFATAKGFFPYGAAKAGLLGLTRSLALDYAADNIRVNAVAPGFVDTRAVRNRLECADDPAATHVALTQAIPLGRLGRADEIAAIVRFLASAEASYVTGATLVADGGLTARRAD